MDKDKIVKDICEDLVNAIKNRDGWVDGVLNISDVVEPHISKLLKEINEKEIS